MGECWRNGRAGDIEVEIKRPGVTPSILKAIVEMATSQRDDGVRATNGPEHAGLFEPGTDDGFATSFDDTRADEQMLTTKLRVAHTFGLLFEIVCLDTKLVDDLRIG